MKEFSFSVPQEIIVGKGSLARLPEAAEKLGRLLAQEKIQIINGAGNIGLMAAISDAAHEAVSAAVDTAHIALHSMKAKKDELFEEEDTKKNQGQMPKILTFDLNL